METCQQLREENQVGNWEQAREVNLVLQVNLQLHQGLMIQISKLLNRVLLSGDSDLKKEKI